MEGTEELKLDLGVRVIASTWGEIFQCTQQWPDHTENPTSAPVLVGQYDTARKIPLS